MSLYTRKWSHRWEDKLFLNGETGSQCSVRSPAKTIYGTQTRNGTRGRERLFCPPGDVIICNGMIINTLAQLGQMLLLLLFFLAYHCHYTNSVQLLAARESDREKRIYFLFTLQQAHHILFMKLLKHIQQRMLKTKSTHHVTLLFIGPIWLWAWNIFSDAVSLTYIQTVAVLVCGWHPSVF